MENKYYTPEVSDFHKGFEFEVRISGTDIWVPITLNFPSSIWGFVSTKYKKDGELIEERIEPDVVRVPYLTKEQIEAEGWEKAMERDYFTKIVNGDEFQLSYQWDNHWGIIFDYDANYVFRGFIKSINEFRKLMEMIAV